MSEELNPYFYKCDEVTGNCTQYVPGRTYELMVPEPAPVTYEKECGNGVAKFTLTDE